MTPNRRNRDTSAQTLAENVTDPVPSDNVAAKNPASVSSEDTTEQVSPPPPLPPPAPPTQSIRQDTVSGQTNAANPEPAEINKQDAIDVASKGYFERVIRNDEHYPICLVGSGQAGTEIASAFRMKPQFVAHYLPELYPVRAATFDTQTATVASQSLTSGWTDPSLQLHIDLPEQSRIPTILERGALRDTGEQLGNLEWVDEVSAFESGGAGGKSIRGRASALLNLFESDRKNIIRQSLDNGNYLSRIHPGYLVSCSSLGGGSGSGFAPVVVKYLHESLRPHPTATYSLCVVPENSGTRSQMNQLVAAYYMASSPVVNGIMLSDNDRLTRQGFKDYTDIDRYLQEVLIPVLLAPLPSYKFGIEMDPANVKTVLQPNASGPEFIVMCFSIAPLGITESPLQKQMRHQTVDRSDTDLLFEELVDKALDCSTVEFLPHTASRSVGLVAGPSSALEALGFLEPMKRERYERLLEHKTLAPSNDKTDCRLFAAKFDDMHEIRLTILLSSAAIPSVEDNIQKVLEGHNISMIKDGSLADRLRALSEESIRQIALADLN